jgi:hypothetical protein
MAEKPTVTVTERGSIAAATPRGSYRQRFADLLDFTSPPPKVAILLPMHRLRAGSRGQGMHCVTPLRPSGRDQAVSGPDRIHPWSLKPTIEKLA